MQKEAIFNSITNKLSIITGGPGTGKSTILNGILNVYSRLNDIPIGSDDFSYKVALVAPTGRAAKRMSEATGFKASTIHKPLGYNFDGDFTYNEDSQMGFSLLIIDEASMMDISIAMSLFVSLRDKCQLILVGDANQLPSVGPGNVLHDLIESKSLDVVELTELYRQGEDSNIISLAYDIRNSSVNKDIFNTHEDLTFIECRDEEVIPNILEICNTYVDLNYHNFQILAPMYKGLNGIDLINKNVKDIFNPKSKNKTSKDVGGELLREGDKVIQLTNMPDDNVYNGDIGLIENIQNGTKKEIKIDFDGNEVRYTASNFNNFRQAYAISIHKAQGSEFDIVVLPLVKGYRKMLYQKLIYTAVTRAKKKLYLIGDMDALKIAVKNTESDIRRTTIKDYLINGID
jgi:exodeoxyribonuclease V alpha subunit